MKIFKVHLQNNKHSSNPVYGTYKIVNCKDLKEVLFLLRAEIPDFKEYKGPRMVLWGGCKGSEWDTQGSEATIAVFDLKENRVAEIEYIEENESVLSKYEHEGTKSEKV